MIATEARKKESRKKLVLRFPRKKSKFQCFQNPTFPGNHFAFLNSGAAGLGE
jgi:hypothetical protein